jgi:hypothetical protein
MFMSAILTHFGPFERPERRALQLIVKAWFRMNYTFANKLLEQVYPVADRDCGFTGLGGIAKNGKANAKG